VEHLLYVEKYTIDGARQKIDDQRKAGELRTAARAALDAETVGLLERQLNDLLAVLEGRATEGRDE
jgi:hypothetical protein